MNDQAQSAPSEQRTIDVVRDSTFVRFVADEAVLTFIGRDLDVAFLQYGPILISQTDLGSEERTDVKKVVTEVARMRMARADFLSMSMDYIQYGILEGALKGEAIQQSVAEWVAEVRSKNEKVEDDKQ